MKDNKIEETEVIEGAKKVEDARLKGAAHKLMCMELRLLEIGNGDIEKIEKERYRLISKCENEDEAVKLFKEFVFKMVLRGEEKASGINAPR